MKTEEIPWIANDLVVCEENCNLGCEYCLTGQSVFKDQHYEQRIFRPPRPHSCAPGTPLRERLLRIVEVTAARGIPILKLSGGEIFLIKGMLGFVREIASRFERIVLQTNAILLSDAMLVDLGQLGNVVIQISFDSVNFAGNSYRVPTLRVHERLMERIFAVLRSPIPVEFYCVLNNRSIPYLAETLATLASYARNGMVFPFPVRGPEKDRFSPDAAQVELLQQTLESTPQYGKILPPQAYLDRLKRFLVGSGRDFRCHLPRVAFTAFDDGLVTSCPNIWFNHVGNLLTDSVPEVFERLETNKFKQLLLHEHPRVDSCRGCFTPWDILSLYFDNAVTLADVAKAPMYSGSKTLERVRWLKNACHHPEVTVPMA